MQFLMNEIVIMIMITIMSIWFQLVSYYKRDYIISNNKNMKISKIYWILISINVK